MTTAAIEDVGRDESGAYTVGHCLREASDLCEAAHRARWDGYLKVARLCYIQAECWLNRASKLRGTYADDGPAVLDARLDVERRMGLAN